MKLLGKDPASLIGRVVWEEFSDLPNSEALNRLMSERIAITEEFYYAPLGEWVENRMFPTSDGGIAKFQRYITGRKRMEMELRRSEAFVGGDAIPACRLRQVLRSRAISFVQIAGEKGAFD